MTTYENLSSLPTSLGMSFNCMLRSLTVIPGKCNSEGQQLQKDIYDGGVDWTKSYDALAKCVNVEGLY